MLSSLFLNSGPPTPTHRGFASRSAEKRNIFPNWFVPARSTGSADTRWPAATAADPEKKYLLSFNFDQLCWIRSLSSSPNSQGGSKVMRRGSKMAPEIGSGESQNSPSRPEAHPGRALSLPAPRKAPGSVRAAADRTLLARAPMTGVPPFHAQPTCPRTL